MTERAPAGPTAAARGLAASVVLLAWLHALFYAVVEPPWSPVNEAQHLDYVLTMTETGRPPDIRQPVRPDVARAVLESSRRPRARGAAPLDAGTILGRRGQSYEGYQPPLYYGAMVPVAALAGAEPLRSMWAIRLVSTLLLPALAAVAWFLTGRWFPEHGVAGRASAALAVASVPVAASSSARVTNDGLVGVLIAGGALALLRLWDRPGLSTAAVAGGLLGAAVLTKSSGMVLIALGAVTLGVLWWRGGVSWRVGAVAFGPALVAATAWAAWTQFRYGAPDGTQVFVTLFGRAPTTPRSIAGVLGELWWNAWIAPPVWRYQMGSSQGLAMGLLSAVAAIGLGGLARTPLPREALVVTAVLSLAAVGVTAVGSVEGVVPPVGRIGLGAYPLVAAITVGGWSRLAGRRGALAVAMVAVLTATVYDVLVFAATARPWWFR